MFNKRSPQKGLYEADNKPGVHTLNLLPTGPEPVGYQKADFSEIRIVSDSNITLDAKLLFQARSFRDVTQEFEIDLPRR